MGAGYSSPTGARRLGAGARSPVEDVDRYVADPDFDKPAGDPCYPLPLGHSDYWVDKAFLGALQELERARPAKVTASDFQATWGMAH